MGKANPFLPECGIYLYKRTKWQEDLAKECKQITTFITSETSNNQDMRESYIKQLLKKGVSIRDIHFKEFSFR